MRYFTFEWAIGSCDDVDPFEEYAQFLGSLDQSNSVRRFATSVSLNDALIDRISFDRRTNELKLLLITGDLQVGYWRTELRYTGATLQGETILADALDYRPTELWYDEFSREDGRLSHNFLLATGTTSQASAREFSIRFDSFSFIQEATATRALSTLKNTSAWL